MPIQPYRVRAGCAARLRGAACPTNVLAGQEIASQFGEGTTFADVAQLVEQLICNQQVAGSSPVASSRKKLAAHSWQLSGKPPAAIRTISGVGASLRAFPLRAESFSWRVG